MEIAPTEKEAGKDRLQLIAHELLLARDACLQFEIKLYLNNCWVVKPFIEYQTK